LELLAEQGRVILSDLEQRRSAGQHMLVESAARAYDGKELPPDVLVRARQMVSDYRDTDRRIESLRLRLPAVLARIDDAEMKQHGEEMVRAVVADLNRNTVNRLAAFELFSTVESTSAETLIAMAVSGWLLGGENSIENISDTWGLFRARQLVIDYATTAEQNSVQRFEIIDRLKSLEGVTVERLSHLIRQLPAFDPPAMEPVPVAGGTAGLFRIPGTTTMTGCLGLVPPEYSDARTYPLVVVFPPRGITPEAVVRDWWMNEACRRGYIVVVPDLYDATTEEYDASAEQHRSVLQLMRLLRMSLRIDDDRVFIAGHGLGGEVAVDLCLSHSDQFAGMVSLGGMGRRHSNLAAENFPSVAGYFVVGDQQVQWRDRLESLIVQLLRRTENREYRDVTICVYPAYGFDRFANEARDVFEWMGVHARTRYPEIVDVQLMRSTDTSWAWLQIGEIPEKFRSLEQPSTWDATPESKMAQVAIRRGGNSFWLTSVASTSRLLISPEIPEFDPGKPVVFNMAGRRRSIGYQPEIAHLLEEFYRTGDRSRLCFMRIDVK
ncbi:MAG: alpha/beta hydrolase, partial [Planctomycetaceae bacterium]|nr:alpha/beta hydrolase [Planctomycetaceae bacterium]